MPQWRKSWQSERGCVGPASIPCTATKSPHRPPFHRWRSTSDNRSRLQNSTTRSRWCWTGRRRWCSRRRRDPRRYSPAIEPRKNRSWRRWTSPEFRETSWSSWWVSSPAWCTTTWGCGSWVDLWGAARGVPLIAAGKSPWLTLQGGKWNESKRFHCVREFDAIFSKRLHMETLTSRESETHQTLVGWKCTTTPQNCG